MKNSLKLFVVLFLLVILNNNSYSQWTATNGPGDYSLMINALALSGENIFAGTFQGVSVSSNNGLTWNMTAPGITDYVQALVVSNGYLFAGTLYDGLFRSSNNGMNWIPANNGLGSLRIIALTEIDDQYVFVSTQFTGVFKSTDNGTTWSSANNGLGPSNVLSLHNDRGTLYAGTVIDGLFRSKDFGNSWQQVGTGVFANMIVTVAASDGVILIGTWVDGAFRSTDNGLSWNQFYIGGTNLIFTIVPYGRNFFAGPFNKGFHASSDYGATWIRMDQGFWNTYFDITSIVITNDYVFAGTSWDTVYRRPISELVSIKNISLENPETYSLSQNYPNPFNPSTKIKFSLPSPQFTKLKVYNSLGQEVATLVNEHLQPGSYEYTFDASGLASGVYFYRLEAGEFVEADKMLLLK